MALRVLIIDGNLAIGRGLAALLGAMPELEVVGVADCPARGLWHVVRTPPDVALVDAELPGLCSSAVIRLLRARSPQTRVVALGTYPKRRPASLEAGAHAFLLKDAGFEALRAAIHGYSTDHGYPTDEEVVADGADAGPSSPEAEPKWV
jgi:DNA-binding NarL/FixJ family response regulator